MVSLMLYRSFLVGMKWVSVGGVRLKQVDSGARGILWGTSAKNKIYYRTGINRKRPTGSGWVHVRGRLNFVSPGCRGVVGVDKRGKIYQYIGK